MSWVAWFVAILGCFRVVIGLAPIVAPGPAMRLLGFPQSHDNPTARLMGRLFGVRDIGLGVLVFVAIGEPQWLGFVCLFNAVHDAGDATALAWPLFRRDGIDRAASIGLAVATSAVGLWLAAWVWVG